MRVVVSGATGFLGRALVARLARDGHEVVALVRSPRAAADKLGGGVGIVAMHDEAAVLSSMADTDAVVNLAGESVAGARWSNKRKQELRDSRIAVTRMLVEAARRVGSKVFVSASAVGYYGDTGDEARDESAPPGDDFLARLCVDWEAEASQAQAFGARVVLARFGVIMGRGGGALSTILRLFKSGVGGKLGDGRQWFSWVHMHDVCEIVAAALTDERYSGGINVTAPNPVTNLELTKTVGAVLGRPTMITTPKIALKLALGEAASAVLASQRVLPGKLRSLGYEFAFPELEGALREITEERHEGE